MRFENVCIEAIGYHLPENVVTSLELETRLKPLYDRLKMPIGRLELMSGIKERRFWEKGTFPSEVSSIAGEDTIKRADFDRQRIGCLINASVCRDFLEPATASVIHDNLKLPGQAVVMDISNACLGVLNGMVTVANMIELGQIEAGLVVAGENGGPLVDHTIETMLASTELNRSRAKLAFASLTIGSAAVGVLLTHKNVSKTGHKLVGGVVRAKTRFNHLCRGSQDSGMHSSTAPLMETDSETLMKEGCAFAGETWVDARKVLGWNNDDIDRVFCHQVGGMHRKLMYQTLGLDIQKDFSTLEFLGNTGAASLPVTMGLGVEQGAIRKGQKAAMLGIGSGLVCLMLGVEW